MFTIGSLRQIQRILNKNKQHANTKRARQKIRYVEFKPNNTYTLVRLGKTFTFESDFVGATESDISYFQHLDPKIVRSKVVPKFIATFHLADGRFIHVQQTQLKHIYISVGRRNRKNANLILADGTPYWVDKYAARVESELLSKKRYLKKDGR